MDSLADWEASHQDIEVTERDCKNSAFSADRDVDDIDARPVELAPLNP
ncbi:MAG: hypothetical protein JOZ75_14935 [Candidatus Dormibacteraeota bacterium]|nr:hypothetical protein [Candidatus Dormibacteraeota bacterium]